MNKFPGMDINLVSCVTHNDHLLEFQLLDYLENEFLVLSFFGKLRPKKMRNLFKSQSKYKNYNTTSGTDTGSLYRLRDYQKQVAELSVLKKSEIRLQQKFVSLIICN
jgi:hypothetical protein